MSEETPAQSGAPWTGSVRWADAADPEAWKPRTQALPLVEEPAEALEAGGSGTSAASSRAEGADERAEADSGGQEDAEAHADAEAGAAVPVRAGGDLPSAEAHADASSPGGEPEASSGDASARSAEAEGEHASAPSADGTSRARTGEEPAPLADESGEWSVPGDPDAERELYEEAAAREADEVADTVYELRSAAQRLEELLIGGKRVLTRKEVAQLAEVSSVSARKLWRALGQPLIPEGEAAYTVKDAEAVRSIADLVASGLVDEETAMQFARGVGQMTDRLVVWQMEAMVEYLTEEKDLSDAEARRAVLDVFADLVDPLQGLMVYAWRRNLAGVLSRLNVNVEDALEIGGVARGHDATMPLARAIGFIDLVSYTRLSQQLDSRELGQLVKHFQFLAYNIVAAGGGRVIKTVGDEVFFSAETPQSGAEIAMTLLEQVKADESLPQCRVGISWGRVLSRMGDIFGTTVNLAARLTAVAEPGTVVTDADTARIIERDRTFEFSGRRDISLQGLGEVGVVEMHRLSAGTIATEDIID
ncbi:adenylate/guanylate cyclase domain-containing protein [Brevibacterium salitolerans]|uniref:Guanylate cyclase domain-containing protein n=1 Tax=Brevibacterium salitolerans TaxID=1403566 RepID=A0ABP5HXU4_9MICO